MKDQLKKIIFLLNLLHISIPNQKYQQINIKLYINIKL